MTNNTDELTASGRSGVGFLDRGQALQSKDWRFWSSRVIAWLLAATIPPALISVLLEYGFYEPPADFLTPRLLHAVQLALVAAFVLDRLVQLLAARRRVAEIRSHLLDYGFIAAGAAVLLVESRLLRGSLVPGGTVYITSLQIFILGRLGLKLSWLNLELAERRIHPTRLLCVSFLVLIFLGTVMLSLPRASRPVLWGDSTHYMLQHLLNCLFTATSATCVTGLVVYDTGSDFTLFGQIVILVLMQMGGLGIMIFGGVFGLLLGRHISLRETMALQDAISRDAIGQIGSLVKFIVVATFALEAIGAAVLYPMWDASVGGPVTRLYCSIFHAVSAFCNAGFALRADSLIAYRTAWQVYAVVIPLIVLGGIGFPAAHDMYSVAKNRLRYWRARRRYVQGGSPRPIRPQRMSLSLHSRIVLAASAILIVVGAGLLFAAETPLPIGSRHAPPAEGPAPAPPQPDSMVGMSWGHRLAAALFQSVTARTAGFNTVRTDEETMSPASHFLLCVLMFIGGSPASTAGGVKTVAVAVLVLAVLARLRRRQNVEVFARRVEDEYVARASALIIGMFALVVLVTLALALTENASLREVMFESVSACGTVGLSTGLTPRLTVPGKVVIILAMFAGRVGPLTFLIALAGRTRSLRYEYPTEAVIIG